MVDTKSTGKFAEKAMMRSDLLVHSSTPSATKFQEGTRHVSHPSLPLVQISAP